MELNIYWEIFIEKLKVSSFPNLLRFGKVKMFQAFLSFKGLGEVKKLQIDYNLNSKYSKYILFTFRVYVTYKSL